MEILGVEMVAVVSLEIFHLLVDVTLEYLGLT